MAKRPKNVTTRKRDENRIVIPSDPTRPVARGHEYGFGRATTAHPMTTEMSRNATAVSCGFAPTSRSASSA